MWFIIALISFFLMSFTAISDRFLLTKSKLLPISYAFTIAVLSSLAAAFLVFFVPDFYFPAYWYKALISGAGFYFAIYFMYQVVASYEVSKVSPIISSLIPIFAYLLTIFVVVDRLSWIKFFGVLVIIASSYLLSQVGHKKIRLPWSALMLSAFAAFMFGIHQVFNKAVYESGDFLNGFVWIRWSILVTAIIFTLFSGQLKNLFIKNEPPTKKIGPRLVSVRAQWTILIIGQICGAVATLLQQYAVNLGSVILVTALQGTQYFFILLFALILTKKFPKLFFEEVSSNVLKQKFVYSLLLFVGVFMILI